MWYQTQAVSIHVLFYWYLHPVYMLVLYDLLLIHLTLRQ